MDDNKVVRGRCPWMDDNEVVHGQRKPWMIQPSIQWTNKRATLRKVRHVRAVNKPMIIALNSVSSF